jgi:carbon monoxide dehydrogenase subunit G
MPRVTVGIDIAAPLERVWQALADLATHGEWMSDVETITFKDAQRMGVGTRFTVGTKVGPFRTQDQMSITAWEPPRVIEVEHHGIVTGVGEFRLQPVAGATRITWSEELRFPRRWGGALFAYLATPVLAYIWRKNLTQFKQRLEGGRD